MHVCGDWKHDAPMWIAWLSQHWHAVRAAWRGLRW